VVPIPKVKGTRKLEKFRSINKLPIYEKILESTVHKQLIEYLESNDLKCLKKCQSDFKAKHSCKIALQWIILDWKKTIGDNKNKKDNKKGVLRIKKNIRGSRQKNFDK